ncbi:MAG: phosphoglucomutase/phosphomannomutase family protein [Deltaproteobacteria bacterium]|nr:phosphoglucomutase/phosphomannomutase family protein [Deltaproteobacteria bacterium]MCL5277905.1 phosphoglucomutase/phosphomannomutase family protein [Deltaproteobacteria bacterium]
MENLIKFGTSGFRGVIADSFTFKTLAATVHAIADYVHAHPVNNPPRIMVGYDPRFMGDVFAGRVAEELNTLGIDVLLTDRDTPTPVISFYVIKHGLDGAVNITASHNPPVYTGIKFTPSWGGPAMLEETKQIEALANHYLESSLFQQSAGGKGATMTVDPMPEYIDDLEDKIDFKAITKANLKVAIDPMHGAGRGYLKSICEIHGIKHVLIHEGKDAYFGGSAPDPEGTNLDGLRKLMQDDGTIALGMATDGDADRFGIVDRNGRPVLPGYVLSVLSEYILTTRDFKGGIGRSVATTHLIDRVARQHKRELYETPVGFKHIGKLLSEGKIFFGGEESGGLSIAGHVPEKDGIIAGLLVLEAVAETNKSVSFLLEDIYKMVGTLYDERRDVQLDDAALAKAKELISTPSMLIDTLRPLSVDRTDGLRLLLEGGSWVLLRLSGTEPVMRIYAEGRKQTEAEQYIAMTMDVLDHA